MTVDVITDIIIAQPTEVVSVYAAKPDHAPEWYVNIKSVEWMTPKPLKVGTQIAFIAQFLGRKLSYTYEIIEYIPGKKLIMQTFNGPFPMQTTYTWEPINGTQTHMILRNKGNPSGFSRLFAPFMTSAMRRANKKDLKRLKRILENHKTI